ncbi:MAG TPA: hypothetical protein VLZ74_15125 [Methylocella sp.]|nr:hypothetical protein [Methylocella sp.]
MMITSLPPFNPFPGLRPFEPEDTHLFFGRDQQIDELLRRLGKDCFLAVTGESGSGKSSLIRAGLLPALYGGFIARAGSGWRIAIFRPGSDPITQLALALAETEVLGNPTLDAEIQSALLETTLRRGGVGLVEAVRHARLAPTEQLLIVVDQFEEIFRFKRAGFAPNVANEAAAFVKLLLEAVRQEEIPIYVVLTMRSDFIGDCAEFQDLPEAINEGMYLIPRMTRDQLREACVGPVKVGGGDMTPRLVQTLLNELGDDPDQLPLLQHALLRTWDYWERGKTSPHPIDLEHYEAIGGIREALSRHADEAFFALDAPSRQVAEKLFKCICDRGCDNRPVRRPSSVREICEVAEASEAAVADIIECFRASERSFLMPPPDRLLMPDTVIDIGHESLIRQWQRLRNWAQEDAESRDIYLRLAEAADRHAQGKAALWRDPELQLALDWHEQQRPTLAWGRRFHPAFEETMRFLGASRSNRDEEIRRAAAARQAARRQGYAIASVILTVIFGILLYIAILATRKAEDELDVALVGQLASDAQSVESGKAALIERGILLTIEAVRRLGHVPLSVPVRSELALKSQAVLEDGLDLLTKPQMQMAPGGPVHAVAFSPDGRYLATGSASGAAIWSRQDGKLIARWGGVAVRSVAFSPDSSFLAVANQEGTVTVVDPTSARIKFRLSAAAVPSQPVHALAVSHDGRYVLTGDDGGKACVWRSDTGARLACLVHGGSLQAVAFSPDDRSVATGSSDNSAHLWRWQTRDGARVVKLVQRDTVRALAFSPDGHYLVTGSGDGTVAVWDADQNQDGKRLVCTLRHRGPVTAVAFSPDGTVLATGSVDRTVRLWTWRAMATKEHEFQSLSHEDAVLAIAFSPDSRHVATASEDYTARIWETESGREVARLAHQTGPIGAVAFSPDGRSVATGSYDGSAMVWSPSPDPGAITLSHANRVGAVAYSPSGRLIVTGGDDHRARLWDAATGALRFDLRQDGAVMAVAFSRDERLLATASDDGTARLWEVGTGKEIARLSHKGIVGSVAFSADGHYLVTGSADNTARIWRTDSGAQVAQFLHLDSVNEVAFSPDGRSVATGSEDQTARIWDVTTSKEVLRIHFDGPVRTVAFSPDGKSFAAGGLDDAASLWSLESRREIVRLVHRGPIKIVRFSPDSRLLATGSADNTVGLWTVADGKLAQRLTQEGSIQAVAFSPDSRWLATGSDDHTARVWEVASGMEQIRLSHAGPVRSVVFDPIDGGHLVSSSSDNTAWVRIWNRPVQRRWVDACARLTRNLTVQEWKRYFDDVPYRRTCPDLPDG